MNVIIIIISCFIGILSAYVWLFYKKKQRNLNQNSENKNADHIPLTQLLQGQQAFIVQIDTECKGVERHRLLDLSFVKGSEISVYLTSPMQNPKAYLIRNTVIALRNDQAQHILVKLCTDTE